jgi:outer membrane lipoprotein-sorting protein
MAIGRDVRAGFAVLLLLSSGAFADDAPAPAEADGRLASVLSEWQRRSAATKSLDVHFSMTDFKTSFEERILGGRVVLLREGRAFVEMTTYTRVGVAVATDRIVWNKDGVHMLRLKEKEHTVWPREAKYKDRLPAVLALPFLWGVNTESLKAHYRVTLVKENAESFYLTFVPLVQKDSPSFSQAILQLDRATYLPQRYVVMSANSKSVKDFRATKTQRDEPIPEDALRIPEDDDWRVARRGESKVEAWLLGLFKPDLLP